MEFISTAYEPIRVTGVSMKIVENISILHRLGMHLRAGAELVKVTSQFKSRVQVSGGGHVVNAKSLLGLLTGC